MMLLLELAKFEACCMSLSQGDQYVNIYIDRCAGITHVPLFL